MALTHCQHLRYGHEVIVNWVVHPSGWSGDLMTIPLFLFAVLQWWCFVVESVRKPDLK